MLNVAERPVGVALLPAMMSALIGTATIGTATIGAAMIRPGNCGGTGQRGGNGARKKGSEQGHNATFTRAFYQRPLNAL